jgi:hypothetical protein
MNVLINPTFALRELVDGLEDLSEFRQLVISIADVLDPETKRDTLRLTGLFELLVKTFFRRSRIYLDAYKQRQLSVDSAFESFSESFTPRKVEKRYIAPIEGVGFSEHCLDFGRFRIKKFSEEEVNKIFENDVNEAFYPQAKVDAKGLASYHCLEVSSVYRIETPGAEFLEGFSGSRKLGPKFTTFPEPLEQPLSKLVLYDWKRGDSIRVIKKTSFADAWARFTIPCIFEVDGNLLKQPMHESKIPIQESFIVHQTRETLGKSQRNEIEISGAELQNFITFITEMNGILDRLENKTKGWLFIDVALGFLLKAFFANGLDELLWHTTTIESLLGEKKESLTKLLSRRIGVILGSTPEETNQIRDKFEKLYDFRSKLVHGNQELLPATKADAGHLQEARKTAREVLVWFLRFLDYIQVEFKNSTLGVPKRSEILRVIDLDPGSTPRFRKLLEVLPDGFPHVKDWPKQNSSMTTEVNCV